MVKGLYRYKPLTKKSCQKTAKKLLIFYLITIIMTHKHQCIRHPEKSPLVILRSEYLQLTGNHCAAKLLSILEYWSNKLIEKAEKLNTQAREWIYKSYDDLYNELMGEHGIHSIRKAISKLVELGFIHQRHNPWHKHDRKYQYQLDIDNLQKSLDALSGAIVHSSQMHESEVNDGLVSNEECNAQNRAIYIDNNTDYSSQIESQTSDDVFENKENCIKKVAIALKIPIGQASMTLYHWFISWRNDAFRREEIANTLNQVGLSPRIFELFST